MHRPSIDQNITFLYTLDLAATAHFYLNLLKLPMALNQGSCQIYKVCGDSYLGFCQRADTPTYPKGIICTIVTDEVDQWYDYLRNQGVNFEQTPTFNQTYNIYHCICRDPNGYRIEIQRFMDPSWPSI